MSKRVTHLRPSTVYHVGTTKTRCGRMIFGVPEDMAAAVTSFSNLDATVHGPLVTCERCLFEMRQP